MIEYFLVGHAFHEIVKVHKDAQTPELSAHLFGIRIFSRNPSVNLTIPIGFSQAPSPEQLQSLRELFELRLPLISFFKFSVTLQFRKISNPSSIAKDKVFQLSKPMSLLPSPAFLVLNAQILQGLAVLLNLKAKTPEKIENQFASLLLLPPRNLSDRLLKLPMTELQKLLNLFLSQTIANPQMLAAYASTFQDGGTRLLQAVSQNNRKLIQSHLTEKNRNAKWIAETEYLIYDNLYRLFSQNKSLPELEPWSLAIRKQKADLLQALLQKHPLFEQLKQTLLLHPVPKIQQELSARKWSLALSFLTPSEIDALFSGKISRHGLILLKEDASHAMGQAPLLERQSALQELIEILFSLRWMEKIRDISLLDLAEKVLTVPQKLETFARLSGIASVLTLCNNMPHTWQKNQIRGSLLYLYHDWQKKQIQLHFKSSVQDENSIKLKILELRFLGWI